MAKRTYELDTIRNPLFEDLDHSTQACWLYLFTNVPNTGIGEYSEQRLKKKFSSNALKQLVERGVITIDEENSLYLIEDVVTCNHIYYKETKDNGKAVARKYVTDIMRYRHSPLSFRLFHILMDVVHADSQTCAELERLRPMLFEIHQPVKKTRKKSPRKPKALKPVEVKDDFFDDEEASTIVEVKPELSLPVKVPPVVKTEEEIAAEKQAKLEAFRKKTNDEILGKTNTTQ